MEQGLTLIIAIVGSVFASSGFWAFMMNRQALYCSTNDLLLGLGHDRLIFLGSRYIERGWITREEYDNLHTYLYLPYKKMKGNGTVSRIMAQVNTLPLRTLSATDAAALMSSTKTTSQQ